MAPILNLLTVVSALVGTSFGLANVRICDQPFGSPAANCRQQDAGNGVCYNVTPEFNDRVVSALITGGSCVFWQ
ncbi:unnamed protein product [Parascedosporium putredinis]|uniref:Uncharacterized protein n=1 Tax=Parascedosporium putredinis TaxID=1442378 RepID=A0A9P1GZP1_9PEZI|nr:unnamed protein product [Parascedosporium putredinis]CAI7993060.1 unnamed protein product [Parascedosporium putredinis]